MSVSIQLPPPGPTPLTVQRGEMCEAIDVPRPCQRGHGPRVWFNPSRTPVRVPAAPGLLPWCRWAADARLLDCTVRSLLSLARPVLPGLRLRVTSGGIFLCLSRGRAADALLMQHLQAMASPALPRWVQPGVGLAQQPGITASPSRETPERRVELEMSRDRAKEPARLRLAGGKDTWKRGREGGKGLQSCRGCWGEEPAGRRELRSAGGAWLAVLS